MHPPKLSSFLVTFMRVVGSTVLGRNSAVLVGGEGQVGSLDEDDADDAGERMEDAEAYGTLGLVFRPRPPDPSTGLAAEVMAVRSGDGKMVPLAWRDLRLNRRFPAPKPGSVALVGYGGGFLALDDSDPTAGAMTKATLYVPYAFSGGVAGKALVVALDPEQESISLIHGDGYAITLAKDTGITMRADESTWMNMKSGETTVASAKIVLQGNVAVGASPTTALPLLAGPASPPCPSLFVSAV